MLDFLFKLSALLSAHDKKFIVALFFFSILISCIELVGISAIMPFIQTAVDFSKIYTNAYYQMVYIFFGFSSATDFVITFGYVLILFYFFRSGLNLYYFHMLARFAFGRYHHIALKLFQNYLKLNYQGFTSANSAHFLKNITQEAHNMTQILSALLLLSSEIVIVVLIYLMLILLNWKITLLITLILLLKALFLIKVISSRIKQKGRELESLQKKFHEIILAAFGNFKLLKLFDRSDIETRFSQASLQATKAKINAQTLHHVPRLFLEAVGFSLMIFVIIYLIYKYEQDISTQLGLLSMYVLALYRLMPSVNRIFNNYNLVMNHYRAFEIIHKGLMFSETENLGNDAISFDDSIVLSDITFGYHDNANILEHINLTIAKGDKIAITGKSGSGKSTLIDLIMGLYKPSNGSILIDGIVLDDNNISAWRRKIGYIPQEVYLFDGTVGENVAFGRPYDENQLIQVLEKTKIWDYLSTQEGLKTKVGEGGVLLSGGQKQRIAIARALYSDPDILILDEATSALDEGTEASIMHELYTLASDKTMLIIAHRLSTIQQCNAQYRLDGCKLLKMGLNNVNH